MDNLSGTVNSWTGVKNKKEEEIKKTTKNVAKSNQNSNSPEDNYDENELIKSIDVALDKTKKEYNKNSTKNLYDTIISLQQAKDSLKNFN